MTDKKLTIYEKLQRVQAELKAPKGQYNLFGKYKYRSCEDILEAVKPLLNKVGAVIILSDEIFNLGGRFYVQATARFIAEEGEIQNHASAREEESKKGMDGSQITGAASSYARKYALNGLLCIDDTKDADATNTQDQQYEMKPQKKADPLAFFSDLVKDDPAKDELIARFKAMDVDGQRALAKEYKDGQKAKESQKAAA